MRLSRPFRQAHIAEHRFLGCGLRFLVTRQRGRNQDHPAAPVQVPLIQLGRHVQRGVDPTESVPVAVCRSSVPPAPFGMLRSTEPDDERTWTWWGAIRSSASMSPEALSSSQESAEAARARRHFRSLARRCAGGECADHIVPVGLSTPTSQAGQILALTGPEPAVPEGLQGIDERRRLGGVTGRLDVTLAGSGAGSGQHAEGYKKAGDVSCVRRCGWPACIEQSGLTTLAPFRCR